MEVKEQSGTVTDTSAVTVTGTGKVTAKFQIGASDEDFEDQNEEEEQYEIIPPDGGWGWVVVAASFMCNVVVDGIIFTSGMLFPKLRETFGASNAEVAWISSLLGGFYLIVGPFVSALASAFGFRNVCIVGSIIASAACVLSYFATSIYFLYGSFGVLGGMGFGLIYVPAVITTGFYFERRRALATGIAVCGSGIGTFIMSPVNTYILTSVENWQIIFLVYAGIIITCSIYAFAFRPLTAATGRRVKVGEDVDISGTPLLIRIKRARVQEMINCQSALSFGSLYSRTSSKATLEEAQLCNTEPRVSQALVARNLLERHGGGNITKRISVTGAMTMPILEEAEHHSDEDNGGGCHTKNASLQLLTPNGGDKHLTSMQVGSSGSLGMKSDSGNKCQLDDNKNETKKSLASKYPRIESAPVLNARSNFLTVEGSAKSRRASKISLRSEHSRPFYRDDMFYSGSLARLPQFQSSDTLSQFHMSVTNIPPEETTDVDSNGHSSGKCCPPSVRHILLRIFDFSLLSSITFIFLSITGFMALMALFVPFNFLPSYAIELGIDPGDASFIMSLIGICNTVGRIIAGWISDHPKVDALLVNNLALMIGGGATILLPFMTNLSLLYVYAVLFGLSVAAFASLRSILLVELLGLEKLTNAFGLLLLFQGFAATFGSPIAGLFVDMTQEYKLSFYVFGGIFALSGLLCIPLRKIKAWEDNRIDERLRREKYGVA